MATILENVYALSAHLEDAYDALEAKGATIPATKNATNLSATIDTVQSGISPTDLFAPDADLVFAGLTAIPNYPSDLPGKFSQWTNIKSVSFPDLTSVGSYGCQQMFYGCTSLTTIPSLPATTLANYCYTGMFSGCASLTTAPTTLPATTLAEYCYNSMFQDCTSLTTAPALPATTLTNYCYAYMFAYCTSLTTAPALPATTLAERCYLYMFSGCASLTTAPALPATTLANRCYNGMFRYCTGLTGTITIPVLNTQTYIPTLALQFMFQNCPNLTKVILDFSTFSSIPTLGAANDINVFNSTTDTRFEIHVPAALEATWKTASNWSTWASHIVGV